MKRTLAILSVVLLLLIAVALPLLAAPASLPPTQGTDAIRAAVQNRLETLPDPDLRWQVAETVQAGDWAYATARATSRTSGQPAPTEPLVILARRAADGSWQAALPGERLFDAWLAAAPESLIDAQTKRYLGTSPAPAGPQAEVTGYKVPWLEGYKGTVVRRDGTNHDKQVDFNLWIRFQRLGRGHRRRRQGRDRRLCQRLEQQRLCQPGLLAPGQHGRHPPRRQRVLVVRAPGLPERARGRLCRGRHRQRRAHRRRGRNRLCHGRAPALHGFFGPAHPARSQRSQCRGLAPEPPHL